MIYGNFKDIAENVISVAINANGNNIQIEDGKENQIYFIGEDPIHIETKMEDSFEPIIKRTCEINLLTSKYLGDYLFTKDDRGVSLRITNETQNEILFDGYVQPLTFSQDYNAVYNTFTLNCIDHLSTLEHHYYKEGTKYETAVSNAKNVSFKQLLIDAMGTTLPIYYDNSIKPTEAPNSDIFANTYINELLFLGTDEDNVWSMEEVLMEILRYYSLHIRYYNGAYYIYHTDSVKKRTSITFSRLDKSAEPIIFSPSTRLIEKDNYALNDTNLEIADTYNQIKVKCNLKEIGTVISNPLDDDALYSPFVNKQKYISLLYCKGNDAKAKQAIYDLKTKGTSDNKNAYTKDFYMQRYKSNAWKLNTDSKYADGYMQYGIFYELKDKTCQGAIIAFGESPEISQSDNEPISKIDMKKSLIISINGNGKQTADTVQPNETSLQTYSPIAEYKSKTAGGAYSPTENGITNYLVFSGQFVLKAPYPVSGYYTMLQDDVASMQPQKLTGDSADMDIFKCWTALYPNDNPTPETTVMKVVFPQPYISSFNYAPSDDNHGGVNDSGIYKLKYKYSAFWDSTTDKFTKLPIFLCTLKIGNKWCVEWDANGNFTPNQFRWVTDANVPTKNGIKLNTMTLGCNPKIDDWIINQEHHIANTLEYVQNVDAEGTAIPIRKSDNLNGELEFKIISPFNAMWDSITRVHPTGFRHTTWGTEARSVLSYLEYIIITSFECKLYSDNGQINNTVSKDLVYVSNEYQSKYNIYETDFKINTALTATEANAKGVTTVPKLSNPNNADGSPIRNATNTITGDQGKPEELFIDAKWREYNEPRIILRTTVHHSEINDNPFQRYTVSGNYDFKKSFFPTSTEYDVKTNRNTITLKEIEQ